MDFLGRSLAFSSAWVSDGFRVLGFRVLGFRVLGFRVLGFRVLGFRVLGFRGFRIQDSWFALFLLSRQEGCRYY